MGENDPNGTTKISDLIGKELVGWYLETWYVIFETGERGEHNYIVGYSKLENIAHICAEGNGWHGGTASVRQTVVLTNGTLAYELKESDREVRLNDTELLAKAKAKAMAKLSESEKALLQLK